MMRPEGTRPYKQKTIGVLGGMSNQATGEYYRLLYRKLNDRLGGWDNGEIIIVSVNFGNIEHSVRNNRWEEAYAYLANKVDRLERAGADLVLCVSNTMHRVVEPIMAERRTPFIHIADPTGQAIRRAEIGRVGLLGTMPGDDLHRAWRSLPRALRRGDRGPGRGRPANRRPDHLRRVGAR